MFSEFEMAVIIQAAPTAWMSPPKFEAMLAIQMVRNVSTLKGASVGIRSAKMHSSVCHAYRVIGRDSVNSSRGSPGKTETLAIAGPRAYMKAIFLIVR
jgi:hypothetical protein